MFEEAMTQVEDRAAAERETMSEAAAFFMWEMSAEASCHAHARMVAEEAGDTAAERRHAAIRDAANVWFEVFAEVAETV